MRILTVALTGGIAAGKSVIAGVLAGHKCFIHSADQVAHELMLPGRPAWSRIIDRFGTGILDPDQKVACGILPASKVLWLDEDKK